MTVLIVDDERSIVEILKYNLKKEGYITLEALDGEAGLALARSEDPDLMLLDLMLPKLSGLDVCRILREEGQTIPIIMLTAREEENDKILGLETGADDYITKPFSMRELMARVKANIRRRSIDTAAPATRPEVLQNPSAGLTLDTNRYAVLKNGRTIDLTQKEYDLLQYLLSAPDRVFTRENLMSNVWNYDYYGDMRTVDVTIRRLREKIEDDPGKPVHIKTKRGVGYFYCSDSDQPAQ